VNRIDEQKSIGDGRWTPRFAVAFVAAGHRLVLATCRSALLRKSPDIAPAGLGQRAHACTQKSWLTLEVHVGYNDAQQVAPFDFGQISG
jgi:hypothetical protein